MGWLLLLLSCSPPTERSNPYDPRSVNHDSSLLPVVLSVFPIVGETNAALLSAIYATYNLELDPESVNSQSLRVLDTGGRKVSGLVSSVGKIARFSPLVPFIPGSNYTAVLGRTICGTNGAPMTNEYRWAFTATTNPAGVYPTVVSTVPEKGATNVQRTAALTVNFSEVLDPITLNEQTFLVNKASWGSVRGVITCDGATARFVPDVPMDYGTGYSARLTIGIKNAAGRNMLAEYRFDYATEQLVLGMTNWTCAVAPGTFNSVAAHGLIAFQDQLFIVCGASVLNSSNCYQSSDGTNWNLTITSIAKSSHGCVVYNGKAWILGGGGGSSDDIFSSINGTTWVLENSLAEFGARSTANSVAEFKGRLWLVGGYIAGEYKDSWWSDTGSTWYRATLDAGFFPRYAHGLIAFNGALWVVGGYSTSISNRALNDIWYSYNGTNWFVATASAPFSPRYGFSHNVFNQKIYLFGGQDTNNYFSDIWSSENGTNWTLITTTVPWGQRAYHRTVVWKNKVWLVGGSVLGTKKNDVWYSD